MFLMQALTVYEDGLCSGCGQEKHRAWNPDMQGWYTVDCTTQCAGCGALHKVDEDHGHKHDRGTKLRLIDERPAGQPLRPWPAPAQQVDDQPAHDEQATE